jgi:general L-amino acid transport system permease protein
MFRQGRFWVQLCVVVALIAFAGLLINNITVNLIRTGLGCPTPQPTAMPGP